MERFQERLRALERSAERIPRLMSLINEYQEDESLMLDVPERVWHTLQLVDRDIKNLRYAHNRAKEELEDMIKKLPREFKARHDQ